VWVTTVLAGIFRYVPRTVGVDVETVPLIKEHLFECVGNLQQQRVIIYFILSVRDFGIEIASMKQYFYVMSIVLNFEAVRGKRKV
jgi:hypothetical protein